VPYNKGAIMLRHLQNAALLGVCVLAIVCFTPAESAAQQRPQAVPQLAAGFVASSNQIAAETLDAKSLLLLIGTQITDTEMDCSHFVQYLYAQAGLYYGYMPSRVLYKGIKNFKRVTRPKSGDLIVWQGHVGIVVNPKETTFISALNSGVKTASYQSDYWKKRGRPRFLRYTGQPQEAPALSAHKFNPYVSAQTYGSE
jgi:cell wall-associated NlpC family hydrolase